ncbi:MAG: NADH-ubiquinone oxidoreductase-F iron-sulfur binding region domain-containing protein [Thermoleophilia bacterium]|jgi:NADH:ubiquinone oxidoreductase subunit F (NADH-binding)/ferredoxin
MNRSMLVNACCDRCTHTPALPCKDLIACITNGPLCHDDDACRVSRAGRLKQVQHGGTGTILFVGAGTCGRANGALRLIEKTQAYIQAHSLPVTVVEVGCIGYCQREIIVDLANSDGVRLSYCDLSPENTDEFLDLVFAQGQLRNRFLYGRHGEAPGYEDIPLVADTPFFAHQTRIVLENCGLIDPGSLDAALAAGGFAAAARALTTMTREEVCALVLESGLRGRGGGGFPTGQKWKIALNTPATQKYLICNADEGDPGAFMDRALLEGDPFRVVEGMLIAAYAIGADKGYVYCRAEYPLAIERLQDAIHQCRQAGLLGRNILDSLVDFDITIKRGAGAFVCGEETAILASIEGGRGMPRPRPPYPAVAGLHGKPTVLNNVETLVNVPGIVCRGADWFKNMGIGEVGGTKVFALSGQVQNTGLIEVPMGTPLRDVVYTIGGGAPEGHNIRAVQIGGPSGGCIPDHLLDVPADYGKLQELGAMMGSGGLVVMDERSCMVDVAKYFMEFIRNESCGKCAPCREGTTRMHEILTALTERPVGEEIRRLERFRGLLHLEELAETIADTSLCGLGQSAAKPVLSTLRFFREEYEVHAMEDRCPTGVCQGLREYGIDSALCIGCGICIDNCPSDAIIGKKRKLHYIIVDRCLGCGACADTCPKQAVTVAA